jgi:autotransporter translocation and assembly factor TamB
VLQADAAALKAGIKPARAIQQVNGKAVASVAEVRAALLSAQGGKITVGQGEAPVTLAVTQQALELPVNAADLCYPFVLSDLRLRYLGSSGDEAGLLRLQQGLALIHFKEYDKALEILRDARVSAVQGVSQGTLDYYTGVCLLHMGNVYLSETLQSFNQALKYPQATLFGPDGPILAPLARQALEDLKP